MTNQISKIIKFRFWILVCGFAFCILHFAFFSYAQDANKLTALSKRILETDNSNELYLVFGELADLYFKENKYNELAEYLNSLLAQKKESEQIVTYFRALTRYRQLIYLEEAKNWDEYFNKGNTYREELTEGINKVVASTPSQDPINIYARLLLWQFHKHEGSVALGDTNLSELLSAVSEYSKSAKNPAPIKEVADRLFFYAEKSGARQLYKVYVNLLVTSDINDTQLEKLALDSYKGGNVELATSLYDIYIERISNASPKEELARALSDIAKLFVYKEEGPNEPAYAEYAQKLFDKIEGLGLKDVFDQDLMYLRAFNLEKSGEYVKAKDAYAQLVSSFAASAHLDEANFKLGIIHAYVLCDIKAAKSYFKECAQSQTVNPYLIAGLYQLGLLDEWENNNALAKEHYSKLIEKAGAEFLENIEEAQQRLKEIEEERPIEYNLKTFLDASLKKGPANIQSAKTTLRPSLYVLKKNQECTVASYAYIPQTGCMPLEVKYLWSGDTGRTKPSIDQATFNTSYTSSGAKALNLVVVSPTGIIECSLLLLDVR